MGEFIRKIMYWFRDEETYNNVMNSFFRINRIRKI